MKTGFLLVLGSLFFGLVIGCQKSKPAKPGPAISKEQFQSEIGSASLVIVKFGASWCPPCRQMDGEIAKLRESQFPTKIIEVDIDSNRELAQAFDVSGIPRTFLFKDGKTVQSHLGYMTSQEIEAMVQGQ
jgi:thioredoxin 1